MKRLSYADQALLFFIVGTLVAVGLGIKGIVDGSPFFVLVGIVGLVLGLYIIGRGVRMRNAGGARTSNRPPTDPGAG